VLRSPRSTAGAWLSAHQDLRPVCSSRHTVFALTPSRKCLVAQGFYRRTLVDPNFDGVLRVRRYLCRACRHTVSLLPDFALPYLRFGLEVVARFLKARLGEGRTLKAAGEAAGQGAMPYQRGQHWVRRFRRQAIPLGAALTALTPPPPARDFSARALAMLETIGWRRARGFVFSQLRLHLLGRARSQIPDRP
jgi:hypothetical protein